MQRQILDWLNLKGIFAWRNNTGAMRARYGGKTRYVRFGAVGSPDIFALHKGKLYGIEVKGPKGTLSDEQRAFAAAFERAGGLYIAAWGLNEVEWRIFPLDSYAAIP